MIDNILDNYNPGTLYRTKNKEEKPNTTSIEGYDLIYKPLEIEIMYHLE